MKIDAKTREELKVLSGKLPRIAELDSSGNQIYRAGKFHERGSALLAANPGMRDEFGAPLDPARKYKVRLPKWINHQAELEKAYALKGQPGVEAYIKGIIKAHNTWKQRQRNPIVRIKRWWMKIKKAANS